MFRIVNINMFVHFFPMVDGDRQSLERSSAELSFQRLQGESQPKRISVEGKIKQFMEESNGTNNCLNVIIPTGQRHELGEEDQVIHRGRKAAQAEEDGEVHPLAYMRENIPGGCLGVVVRGRPPTILLELLET